MRALLKALWEMMVRILIVVITIVTFPIWIIPALCLFCLFVVWWKDLCEAAAQAEAYELELVAMDRESSLSATQEAT